MRVTSCGRHCEDARREWRMGRTGDAMQAYNEALPFAVECLSLLGHDCSIDLE